MSETEKRVIELESALRDLYKSSSYNLASKTSSRVTTINNEKFNEIYAKLNIPDLVLNTGEEPFN